MFSGVVTGTAAWRDFAQHKSNEFSGVTLREPGYAALMKLDKETGAPLEGAEFELHKIGEDGSDVCIGGKYVTDENGMIWVDVQEEGEYYWLETGPEYGWTYDDDGKGHEIKEYHFTEETNDHGHLMPIIVKAYNRRLHADLTITKQVLSLNVPGVEEGPGPEDAQGAGEEPGEPAEETTVPEDAAREPAGGNSETAGVSTEPADTEQAQAAAGETSPPGGPAANEENRDIVSGRDAARFEFTVTFTNVDDGPVTLLIDGKELNGAEVAGGKLVFELGDGQKAVIKDLPAGAGYAVEEKPVDGYIGVPDNANGVIPPEGAAVNYVNYYDIPGKLIVKKTVVGENADTEKSFGFTLIINGAETAFELKGGEEREFTLAPGDHWSVYEDDYRAEGYEPSYTVKHSVEDGRALIEYTQVNRYEDPVPVEAVAVPPVKKMIAGNPKENVVFGFRLIAQDGAPMPTGSANREKLITITGAGEANFGQIRYTEPGVYNYTISEVITGKDGWTYDKTVYVFTVTAEKSRGELMAMQSMATIEGMAVGNEAVFTNTFDDKPDKPNKPGKPGNPGNPPGHGDPNTPGTGDSSNIRLWAAAMILSAVALRKLLLCKSLKSPFVTNSYRERQ